MRLVSTAMLPSERKVVTRVNGSPIHASVSSRCGSSRMRNLES